MSPLQLNRTRRATGPADAGAGNPDAPAGRTAGTRTRHWGQALPIFVLSAFVLMGMMAIVIDVSWYWVNTLRLQRAADAAALAGVVQLPGNPATGVSLALAEANRNGYNVSATHCVNALPLLVEPKDKTLQICAVQDADPHQLDVAMTAPVQTFFMQIFGFKSIQATVLSKALFTLPVPMGSPDPYYGDFGPVRFSDNTPTYTLKGPANQTMTARGFWGGMLSQGAETHNGDAYLPHYDTATNRISTMPQDSASHYDYAVYMPPGSSGGQVSIFDPVFCATDATGAYGTGEGWLSGQGDKMSSYYYIYADPNNTPYVITDDTLIGGTTGSTATLFQDVGASDSSQGGSGGQSCRQGATNNQSDGRYWHDRWWQMPLTGAFAGGLTGAPGTGTTYRLRTTTDPRYNPVTSTLGTSTDPVNQNGTNAMNAFAIYVTASSGAPQVYGSGSMEMFTPLPGNTNSRFFLAQIDATVGQGKTMEINLWDPGDTHRLPATLRVLQPCATGSSGCSINVPIPGGGPGNWSYKYTNFDVSAEPGTTDSSVANCSFNASRYSTPNSLQTNIGGSNTPGLFNGCWVTIDVAIPTTYTAPNSGWWMIEYGMGGSSSNSASDLTTWQVSVLGNPVHLIVP